MRVSNDMFLLLPIWLD